MNLYINKVSAWAGRLLPVWFSAMMLLLSACDQIDENNRFIYVEPAHVYRAVLVEDFTGQRCVNCPAATEELDMLQKRYGQENVVVVAFHSGPFGHRTTISSPRLPLCTEIGDTYYSYWGIENQPGVLINRVGDVCYDKTMYVTRISEELE